MHNPDNDDADWKAAAMAHDSLVVEILLSLKHSTTRPCHGKLVALTGWGAKQLRSGSRSSITASGSKSVSDCRRIGRRSRRCSPSTPLSWSGGSGGGGVMDGCDASSLLHNQWPRSRSKQSSCAVTEVNGAICSKNRKKKTYAELKVEEDMLLKERMCLHKELSMLGAIVAEHRAQNETLKRIKVNFITKSMKDKSSNACGTSVPNAEEQDQVSLALLPATARLLTPSSTSCHEEESDVITGQKRSNLMLLPDLNMMPSELESAN